MNDTVPDPHPIRLRSTLAGAVVAIAAGSLLSGASCAATSAPVGIVFLLTQWLFAAACLFAANQLWVGRDRLERFEMLVVCLGMALALMPALWMGSIKAFTAFGGTWP